MSTAVNHFEVDTLVMIGRKGSLPPQYSFKKPITQCNYEINIRQILLEGHSTTHLTSAPQTCQDHPNKKCPRDCHNQKLKETWQLMNGGIPGWNPEMGKDII
jgi:hypothetical protein